MPVLCAVAGQARAARRERGGPRRLSARNLPARFSRSVGRESARVLQARGDAGDGAQDEVDESCLLALRELFLVHLLAQRPEGEHLGDGQRVHVRGADADGLAEHVAVLQRPLVAHDGQNPLAGELHLVEHLLIEVLAVAEGKVHPGDALIRLGDGHLDVVDEGGEQRPFLVSLTHGLQIAELLACGAETVPGGQVDLSVSAIPAFF